MNDVFISISHALGLKVNSDLQAEENITEKLRAAGIEPFSTDSNCLRIHLLNEAAKKTSQFVGDGTYTAAILSAAMTSLVIKSLEEGSDPKLLNRGIRYGVELATKYLSEISSPIVTPNELDQVAKTVTNGDVSLAETVTDAFVEVGRDGWIEVKESQTGKDYLEKIKGIKFDSGYLSPEFINEGDKVFYHEIYLLLSEDVLCTPRCVLPSIKAANNERYPLLIIAKDIEGEALQIVLDYRIKEKHRICVVKSPELDVFGRRLLLDLAICCGATIFSDRTLPMLEEIRPKQHFGLVWRAEVTKDMTILTNKSGVRSSNGRIRRNIKDLKSRIMTEDVPCEKELLRERLARFVQRMAVVRVGGRDSEEVSQRCALAKKTVGSLRAALEFGAVPGGGSALVKSLGIPQAGQINDDFSKGVDIVSRTVWVPCMVIAKNAGKNPTELALKLNESHLAQGFDMYTRRFVNMFHEGILDPTKVLISALSFAADVTYGMAQDYARLGKMKN